MSEGDHKRTSSYLSDKKHEFKKVKYNDFHDSDSSPLHKEETAISDLTNQGSITKKFGPGSSAIRVSLEVNKGEYNLNLRSVPTDNAMAEHAHTAAALLSQGELLCKLGMKLLSKL